MASLLRIVRAPVDDYLAALNACLPGFGIWRAFALLAVCALSWWIYVPIHELLHALGCVATGGRVTRLEIDPLYGAALLHEVFPFVAIGSRYAGQLTGFDTRGSDLIYLATDFLPFTLTILIGIPLLRCAAADREHPWRACLKLGVAIPIAYAPFISITGDYYEMGSILVSRLVATCSPGFPVARWRSDDLIKLAGDLSRTAGGIGDAAGLLASFVVGVILIFATYWLGTVWARFLTHRRSAPRLA